MPERVAAKKSLGQCFLVERNYATRIVSALGLRPGEAVLEIGPGRGILTEELLRTGVQTTAIEIDRRLIEPLREKFGHDPTFTLRHEDFLDVELSSIPETASFKIAGNLPYHLVAEVIFKLLAYVRRARSDPTLPWIECAVLMMQKEVADRVAASPATKAWSKLSVFVRLEADPHFMFTVPAGAFHPTPKVDGGVVRFDFLRFPRHLPTDFPTLERIVRFCFHQRRKMLKRSLSSLSGIHPFWQRADLDFTRRPETLTPAEWVELADTIARARA
ncbi:ribosomal RNA small subunit methyltransferase A [bacterium]|nr:ribosomal RNA small subunit methyltransferase A [bacterium]MBU1983133.1 ribosomal RNA small subunit methyltransferase A [bacterium]